LKKYVAWPPLKILQPEPLQVAQFVCAVRSLRDAYKQARPRLLRGEPQDCLGRLEREFSIQTEQCREQYRFIATAEKFLRLDPTPVPELTELERLMNEQRQLHELHLEVNNASLALHSCLWRKLDTEFRLQRFRDLQMATSAFSNSLLNSEGPSNCIKVISDMIDVLPILGQLLSTNIQPRHWRALQQKTGVFFEVDDVLMVGTVLMCDILGNASFVSNIIESARKEEHIERQIASVILAG
jgi:hypothetical protein